MLLVCVLGGFKVGSTLNAFFFFFFFFFFWGGGGFQMGYTLNASCGGGGGGFQMGSTLNASCGGTFKWGLLLMLLVGGLPNGV